MEKQTIGIIGAGRLGKGFVGAVFLDGGWKVHFFDHDESVISELSKGKYEVELHEVDRTFVKEYRGYESSLLDKQHPCCKQLRTCDIWALPLYPDDIAQAITYLLPALQLTLQEKQKRSILILTNLPHFIKTVEHMILEKLSKEEQTLFHSYIEVKDVIIIRSTFATNNASCHLQSIQTMSSLVQRLQFHDISHIPWIKEIDQVEQLKEAKLFALNSWHAACAYAGAYRGYTFMEDAMNDSFCQSIYQGVREKSAIVLQKEFALSEEKIALVQHLVVAKDEIKDSIARVTCEPIRKLHQKDRLVYPAMLCAKEGIDIHEFAQAIALAFLYEHAKDQQSQQLQLFLKDYGIEQAVTIFCGVEEESPLHQAICLAYQNLKRGAKR